MEDQYKSEFSISNIVNEGIETFKTDPGSYIGFFIVGIVIPLVLGLIPFVGSLANVVIGTPLQMGTAIYANKNPRGEGSFNTFFDGFQKLGDFLIYILIIFGCGVIILFPILFGVAALIGFKKTELLNGLSNFTAPLIILSVIVMIFLIILSLLIFFTPYFIYFKDMKAMEAIKASFRLAKPILGKLFLFQIVCGLITLAGTVCLVVGLLVAIPVVRLATYHLFEELTDLKKVNIFDFENTSEEPTITSY